MSIRRTLTIILLLTGSISVFAQTVNPCSTVANAGLPAEILTDTMGVDFAPYMTRVVQIVKQNWYSLIPQSVYPPTLKQGKLAIEFTVSKDGKVSGMKLHPADSSLSLNTGSGDVALDRAAWASIVNSDPLPTLPKEFPGQTLGLRFYYFYNAERTSISISPCGDVQVPTGSTVQFSASVKGTTGTSVAWSVSGTDCSKSTCGTISDAGLYTAPVDIPNPPTVIVQATLRSGPNIIAKSKVIVVKGDSSH
jgi:hypothetical protein